MRGEQVDDIAVVGGHLAADHRPVRSGYADPLSMRQTPNSRGTRSHAFFEAGLDKSNLVVGEAVELVDKAIDLAVH
jgi:hypothetical protein